jgi:hypothetical protein
VVRLANEAVRQADEEKFRIEHEAHMKKLYEEDDLDEIKDDEYIENEEEMTEQ